eukprot:6212167-Pleurochrysis_carterae.AAC.6
MLSFATVAQCALETAVIAQLSRTMRRPESRNSACERAFTAYYTDMHLPIKAQKAPEKRPYSQRLGHISVFQFLCELDTYTIDQLITISTHADK